MVSNKVTYLDSGVLINAFRGVNEVSLKATEILDDSTRLFATSVFVQLETLPKADITISLRRLSFTKRSLMLLLSGQKI